jgi:ABC-type nickel/cobalt efflux system permease component RcnA
MAVIRPAVLALYVIGAAGTVVELLLIGHYEDPWQVAPLGLLAASLVVAGWAGASRGAAAVRAFQLTTASLILIGTVGLWLHWLANSEFEREVSPALTGAAFVWKAIRGASPPSAAPGTLIHLGLLGLLYAHRHPAFDTGEQK